MKLHELDRPHHFNRPQLLQGSRLNLRDINTLAQRFLVAFFVLGSVFIPYYLLSAFIPSRFSNLHGFLNSVLPVSGIIVIFLFLASVTIPVFVAEKYARLLEKESTDISEWKLNDLIENAELIGHLWHIPFAAKIRKALIHRLNQATLEELLDLDRVHRKALSDFFLYYTKNTLPVIEAVLLALIEHPLPEYMPAVRNLARGHDAAYKNRYIRELAQKCLEGLQREANSQNYHRQLLRHPTETGKDTLLRSAGSSPASSEPASELLRSATSSASASSLPGVAPASEEIAAEQTLRAQSSQAE